jgi:hypothetical protein
LEISLAKKKGKEVVDVCRVTMSKVEDFDKPKIVVQIDVRKLGVKDVLPIVMTFFILHIKIL